MPPTETGEPVDRRRPPSAEDFPASGPFSLAAPGPRFGARAVDLAVVALPALIVLAVSFRSVAGQWRFDPPVWLLGAAIAFGVLYEVLSVAVWSRTPGKALMGLKVVRFIDGQRPSPVQALLRALVPWSVLALPLGPFAFGGFLLVYGSGVSGALHRGIPDQAGGTLVISTR